MSYGRDYWRRILASIDERDSGDGGPKRGDAPGGDGVSRRELLHLLGASIALAGLDGCTIDRPRGETVPYVRQPAGVTPSVPQQYATSLVLDGFATGVLVESHEGRPTKIEGNPDHPASLGATSAFEQAAVLELFAPQRARAVGRGGEPSSWRALLEQVAAEPHREGLWFLLYPQSSPQLAELIAAVRARNPGARFVYHTPMSRRAIYAAARRVFGRPLEAQYEFNRADVIVSLDADFLAAMPMSLRWARQFAARRRLGSPDQQPNRLYAVGPTPSPTTSLADHRLNTRAVDVAGVAAGLLSEVLARSPETTAVETAKLRRMLARAAPPAHRRWIRTVAADLLAHRRASLVIAGDQQSEQTHVLSAALNAALRNVGHTVRYSEPALQSPDDGPTLTDLARAIDRDRARTVVVLESNPVYSAPPELELGRRLRQVDQTVHLSLFANETSAACRWVAPALHTLESWGDARAYDGTLSLIQPLIRPLRDGRSSAQLLAAFAGQPDVAPRAMLRAHHRDLGDGSQRSWSQALQRGLVTGSAFVALAPPLRWEAVADTARQLARDRHGDSGDDPLELRLCGSPKVYDGRFANNGWLQELPHPVTKLTWGNAALLSPALAEKRKVRDGSVVELQLGKRSVRAAALVQPGCADDSVTLALGYGRSTDGGERVAAGVGVDGGLLRPKSEAYFATGLKLRVTGEQRALARTQMHHHSHGRHVAPLHTLAELRRDRAALAEDHPQPSLLPERVRTGDQWAMTIDTTICSGCSACVVACQAENNIPIVGKKGVLDGREMQWIRIDSYLHGPRAADPQPVNQPMLCQHCEQAPCEYVCPVNATVHSPDGLNEMVYNRCVGTRFCSNNCPYKVRRFNWFDYNDERSSADLRFNPDVTVRARGVMEKCTYCVQRIRGAQIEARMEERDVRPGEVRTACQQACPTGAIAFGSLRHRKSDVVRWREQPRAYAVLHDLGTHPRTRYLARITDPNPELD